eukprot:302594_1
MNKTQKKNEIDISDDVKEPEKSNRLSCEEEKIICILAKIFTDSEFTFDSDSDARVWSSRIITAAHEYAQSNDTSYTRKMMDIVFNLRKNKHFVKLILFGRLTPTEFVSMSNYGMPSQKTKPILAPIMMSYTSIMHKYNSISCQENPDTRFDDLFNEAVDKLEKTEKFGAMTLD